MRSFNFLCVLDLFSERWQSTLFQIFLLLITFDLEHNVAACFHRSLRVRNHHSGVDKSNVIHYRLHITSRIGSCEEKNRYHSLVATLCFEVDNRSIIHLDKILVPFFLNLTYGDYVNYLLTDTTQGVTAGSNFYHGDGGRPRSLFTEKSPLQSDEHRHQCCPQQSG